MPCKDGQQHPAKWIKQLDGGKVARYTEDDAPGDLPLISDLFAPKEYYEDDNDPTGALPGWFLSALVGMGPPLPQSVVHSTNSPVTIGVLWQKLTATKPWTSSARGCLPKSISLN